MTAGKFMTSATPIDPTSSRSVSSSGTPISAPGLSNGDAGTQLDAHTPNVNGRRVAASASAATPGTPNTLATSCGSAATAVVPWGRTARTNSSIQSLVDSRCMWLSTKPGVSAAPPTSTTSRASRGPQPATTPSAIARSVSIHSRVCGDEHPATGEEEVGRFVTARDREGSAGRGAAGHARMIGAAGGLSPRR